MNLSELEIFIINFGEVALAWNTVRVSCVRILFGYSEVFFIKAFEMLSDWARVFFFVFHRNYYKVSRFSSVIV